MHHKFAIFDGRTLLNGSYNWTRGAARDNQENVMISDDQRLVAQFQGEFDRLGDVRVGRSGRLSWVVQVEQTSVHRSYRFPRRTSSSW